MSVAPSENYQIREIAEIVASVVDGSRVEFAADSGPDARNYRVNCDKIAETLPAYQPVWTAEKGRSRTARRLRGRRDCHVGGVRGSAIPADRPHQGVDRERSNSDSDLRWTRVGATA